MQHYYFKESKPLERRRDPINGMELKGEEGCLPFNRRRTNLKEMDDYFGGYQ